MHGFPVAMPQVYASPRDLVETSKILRLSPQRRVQCCARCDKLEIPCTIHGNMLQAGRCLSGVGWGWEPGRPRFGFGDGAAVRGRGPSKCAQLGTTDINGCHAAPWFQPVPASLCWRAWFDRDDCHMLSHQGISEEATDITILFAGVDTRGTPKDPKSHGSLFETLAKFGHGRNSDIRTTRTTLMAAFQLETSWSSKKRRKRMRKMSMRKSIQMTWLKSLKRLTNSTSSTMLARLGAATVLGIYLSI